MKRFGGEAIQHIYQRSEDGVTILAVSIMFNHFHLLVKASGPDAIRKFVHDVTSMYTRRFNEISGRSGRLFQEGFGRAEKKLCARARDMRWSLLAYSYDPQPYSEKYALRQVLPVSAGLGVLYRQQGFSLSVGK